MTALSTWSCDSHQHRGVSHPFYRKGEGPGIVVVHEVPGLTGPVIAFGEELVEAGYTVVLPHLFGRVEDTVSIPRAAQVLAGLCINREFNVWRSGRTSPVVSWLRDLARRLHEELGGPGVGALGMCLTGGFALAMYVDPSVIAPVLAQPSAPLPVGRRRAADLGMDPAEVEVVRDRCAKGGQALGLRYRSDPAVGTRFETLSRTLGKGFLRVELDGKGHSTLTNERDPEAVEAVLDFFGRQLRGAGGPDTDQVTHG